MPHDTEGLGVDEIARELRHESIIVSAEITLGNVRTINVQSNSADADVDVIVDDALRELATGGYLTDHIVKSYRAMCPEIER